MELKKQGSNVKVTWVCPYAIDTGMFAGFESRQAWLVDVLKVLLHNSCCSMTDSIISARLCNRENC